MHLLEKTQCSYLLTTDDFSQTIGSILGERELRHINVPELHAWLNDSPTMCFPYRKLFKEASREPFAVVQTSGSTGLPKPIVVTHGTLAASDAYHARLEPGRQTVLDIFRDKRCLVTLPQFHIAGIDFVLAKPCYYGMIPVFAPFDAQLNVDLVGSIHKLNVVQCSILPPSIIEDIAKIRSYLTDLRKLHVIAFGGGPLSYGTGELVRPYVQLVNLMGGTEMYCLPTEIVDQVDWRYMDFCRETGAEFVPHSDGLWELCLTRSPLYERYQSIFFTYPELTEWHTQDLYSPHPTKKNLWRYRGRADDIITLSNGEKLNPIAMEERIIAHPEVQSALVVGEGRFQTGLLIEIKSRNVTQEEKLKVRKSLWPHIEEANLDCPAHGKISKDLILFASSQKRFRRSGKGTVQRKATIESYESELDTMYEFVLSYGFASPRVLTEQSPGALISWLPHLLRRIGRWDRLNDDEDFFSLGMDSLQALTLVREINTVLQPVSGRVDVDFVAPSLIYNNPTLRRLTNAIQGLLSVEQTDSEVHSSKKQTAISEMQTLVSEFAWDLEITSREPSRKRAGQPLHVLLTGSTGSLGCYLFDALLRNPNIGRIFCLNRSAAAEDTQRAALEGRGLATQWNTKRVCFLKTDLSKPYFGLDIASYLSLLRKVTHVLHNAWDVNFNLSIASFKATHIYGVRQFIDFSTRSTYGASIFFISSVSAAMSVDSIGMDTVPERVIEDPLAPASIGYAQSKHVAERLLSQACRISGVPTVVCRVGQVAGSVNHLQDRWNIKEWFPSMIASSKYLGKLPYSLGYNEMIDWVPVDILSHVIMDLLIVADRPFSEPRTGNAADREEITPWGLMTKEKTPNGAQFHSENSPPSDVSTVDARVYHAVNPHPIPWCDLLPAILDYFGEPRLQLVSFHEWCASLEASAKGTPDLRLNPAVKLLAFFQSMASHAGTKPIFETKLTKGVSYTHAQLQPVNQEWMKIWLAQWGF